MNTPKPKPDSPFAARASTRAPFPSPADGKTSPPAAVPVASATKSGLPWGVIIAVLVIGGGLAAWWFTRSTPPPRQAKSTSTTAPAVSTPTAAAPAPAQAAPAPTVTVAENASKLKATYERLAGLTSSLSLSAQERAAFANTTMAANQAQSRFAAGEIEAAALRWKDAAQTLGQILHAKLSAAYEAESSALRGLNLAEYSGPGVLALSQAQVAADTATKAGDWAGASLLQEEARSLIAKAQNEIAAQLAEAAGNAAARGDTDLATYFYERTLRLDGNQVAAQNHLYLHKFKAGEIIRTSSGLELAYIPPGTFVQGSQPREPGRRPDETPRTVKLTRGFFMGVKEVTQRDWDAVFGEGEAARTLSASRTVSEAKSREGWIGANLPMHSVRWEDAAEFCRRLSTLEKRTFRLPTEAEWEYACRAGVASAFNTGNDGISSRDANVDDGSAEARYALAPASDPSRANRYGLRDMHGNVWEWCADWSAPYAGGSGVITDPTGPSDSEIGRLDSATKAIRGGGWNASASDARSANRAESSPVVGLGYIGLRAVQEPVLIGP